MIILQPVPWTSIFGGLLIVWVSSIPAILYFQGVDRTPSPFLPAIGTYYAVFYGLPIFTTPLAYHQGDRVVLYERFVLGALGWDTILLTAGGVASMFLAFYMGRQVVWRRLPRFRLSESELRPDVLNICYGLLLIGSLAYRLIPVLSAVPSIGQFLLPARYLALGGFFLQWRAGKLPTWQAAVVFLILVPLDVYDRIHVLFITDVVFLGMFFAFILWRNAQFRTLSVIILIGAVIASTYSMTTAYRSGGATFLEKMQLIIQGVLDSSQSGGPTTRQGVGDVGTISYDPRISPLINRIGHIWLMQMVVERTPDPIPYWNGYTYRPLLTSLIPRALYPDKPEERVGGEFGIRYGFAYASSNQTSFNIPWIVELFVNFGAYAVLAGMALFGLVLGGLDKFFNVTEASDLEFLIGLTLTFRLIYQESNLSVMTGSLILQAIAFYTFFTLIALFSKFIFKARP